MGVPCRTAEEYWAHKEHAERLKARFRIVLWVAGILFLIAWRWC
jgi:hypothetical protein